MSESRAAGEEPKPLVQTGLQTVAAEGRVPGSGEFDRVRLFRNE